MIRVGLAEDQKLVREALKKLLDMTAEFCVVFAAEDGQKAYEALCKEAVDVLLLDIQMPILDGVMLSQKLQEEKREVAILILTTFDDEEYIKKALYYGAKGYLLKESGIEEIKEAIRIVKRGGLYMDPKVAGVYVNAMNKLQEGGQESQGEENLLSQREREVALCVAKGLSNKEIAQKLYLSEGTVKNHITHALTKLNLRDRTQLAIYMHGQS